MRHLIELLATVIVVGAIAVLAIVVRSGGSSVERTPAWADGASTDSGGGAAAVQTQQPVVVAPSDLVPLAPALAPKELPGECFSHVTTADGVPSTIKMVTPGSSVVALGTVTEIGPAQWNTPDAAPPSEEDLDAFHVMRLVRLNVDKTISGTASGPVTIWIEGGTIGCQAFYSNVAPNDLAVGDRFALFLDETAPATGLKGVLHSREIWPISGDNQIASPGDGAVSVDVFKSKVAASLP